MRLEDLKEAWAAGMFDQNDERSQAEAENLRHLIALDYDDLDSFYIGTERKKESENGIGNNNE